MECSLLEFNAFMSYYNAVMCINWVQTPLSKLNIQCLHLFKCGEKSEFDMCCGL